MQNALSRYGYKIIETGELDSQTQEVLHAFQTHFLPWKISDHIDEQTVSTLFALLEKYFPKKNEQLLARYQKELTPKVLRDTYTPPCFVNLIELDIRLTITWEILVASPIIVEGSSGSI